MSWDICLSQSGHWVWSSLLLLLSHFSRVRLCATPETAAQQAPPSLACSRQEHWSGVPFPRSIHVAAMPLFHSLLQPHKSPSYIGPHLLYPFVCWWTFRLLRVLAFVNSAPINTGVHVSFQMMVFSSYMPRNGTSGSYSIINSIFSFLRNLRSGRIYVHSHP